MSGRPPFTPGAGAKLAALAARNLDEDEWRATMAIPLSPEEIENTLALVRWFRRRYPDVATRLAYARRAYRRWKRALPPSTG